MTIDASWIENRRGDRELLGWMRPQGEGFVVVDLLGRDISGELDWLAAEELLNETGIGYLVARGASRLGLRVSARDRGERGRCGAGCLGVVQLGLTRWP